MGDYISLFIYINSSVFTFAAEETEMPEGPLFHCLENSPDRAPRALFNKSVLNSLLDTNSFDLKPFISTNKKQMLERIKQDWVVWMKRKWSNAAGLFNPYIPYISFQLEQAYRKGEYLFEASYEKKENTQPAAWSAKKKENPESSWKLKVSLISMHQLEPARMEVTRSPPAFTFKIPPHLEDEIKTGNCVLFVGAGFVKPGGSPGWGELLVQISQKGNEIFQNELKDFFNRQGSMVGKPDFLNSFGDGIVCMPKCKQEEEIDDKLIKCCRARVWQLLSDKISEIMSTSSADRFVDDQPTDKRTTTMRLGNSQSARNRAETPLQLETSQSYIKRAESLPSRQKEPPKRTEEERRNYLDNIKTEIKSKRKNVK